MAKRRLLFSQKGSIVDFWLGSKYASGKKMKTLYFENYFVFDEISLEKYFSNAHGCLLV